MLQPVLSFQAQELLSCDAADVPSVASPRLYTAQAVMRTDEGMIAAFAAAVTDDCTMVARIVGERVGALGEKQCRVEDGFDEFDPFSRTMVPSAISDELVRIRAAPESSVYRGYAVLIERRFTI